MVSKEFAFLDEKPFSWGKVISVIFTLTIFLVVCHLLREYFWSSGPLPKFIAVYPGDPWSLPAIILSNFFHSNTEHLVLNLISFWLVGLWAFKQEKGAAIEGMGYGVVFAGAAMWLFGNGVSLGFSGVVFSLVGILIISSIRIGGVAIVLICLAVYYLFIVPKGMPTLWPSEISEGISWQGHLGGLIGGMYSQIKNPRHALRILAEGKWVTPGEAKVIYNRIPPPLDIDEEAADTNKEKPVSPDP